MRDKCDFSLAITGCRRFVMAQFSVRHFTSRKTVAAFFVSVLLALSFT